MNLTDSHPHMANKFNLYYLRVMCRAIIFCFLLFLGLNSSAQDYLFEINNFQAHEDDLSILGKAQVFEDRMRLTSSNQNEAGGCWYARDMIYLADGFETEFTFLISGQDQKYGGGDGFAFVIQAQGTEALGGLGDDIGYKEIPYVLAIEFDLKNDNEGSRNHVNLSFYDDNKANYRRFATVHEIPEITDGLEHFTRITYQNGSLHVYLDSYLFPVLTVKINIAEKIKSADGRAWLGFTSATSDAYANHDLLQWNVKQYLPAPEVLEENLLVKEKGQILVKSRKLRIQVWDNNTIDGDIVSLKWGDEWLLTDYELQAKKLEIPATLVGFNQKLVLYANNTGMIPPNTVALAIFDGHTTQRIQLESDLKSTESITIQYDGNAQ